MFLLFGSSSVIHTLLPVCLFPVIGAFSQPSGPFPIRANNFNSMDKRQNKKNKKQDQEKDALNKS